VALAAADVKRARSVPGQPPVGHHSVRRPRQSPGTDRARLCRSDRRRSIGRDRAAAAERRNEQGVGES
jgi:hypothetical protein